MKRDHTKLICDIGEIAGLFSTSSSLDDFLQKTVDTIMIHMGADVCSVYLYYEAENELVLKATHGLPPESIGKVKLRLGEGLTGKALLELRAVSEGDALHNPAFKFFDGVDDERFMSFLAMPIVRGNNRIGAITLQSVHKDFFSTEDVNVFRAICSQLAHAIEMAKLLMILERPAAGAAPVRTDTQLRFVKGRSGSQGIAFGEAVVMVRARLEDLLNISMTSRSYSLEDFERAVKATEQDLQKMQSDIETRLFDVASLIFSAQILMLKDQAMLGQMESLILQKVPPPEAVVQVVRLYSERFDRMTNDFIREKRFDVLDVGRRILENLTGSAVDMHDLTGKIVIARELLPSDVLKLGSRGAEGAVILSGGVTSHVAVLARSLNLPLVISEEGRLLNIAAGTALVLDADLGNIYVQPEDAVVAKFREKENLRRNVASMAARIKPVTRTVDGERVTLQANINLLGDAAVALDYKAEGVGLYRTEFPFIIRSDFPSEEEQFLIYRRLVQDMQDREVTFRTLDIGGDKMLSYYDYSKEANPFLGLRSIRFSLRHKDIFAQQVRAILRAGASGNIRLMFPMIGSLDDFCEAREVVAECLRELDQAGAGSYKMPPLGAMVELPAAVAIIDELAREVDFLSIGTNDLVQYTLAVDRTNEKVADLYLPHHPAVLRALKQVADSALRHKRDLSVCGDLAHDPVYIAFLLGIGIRKLSLDARYLPAVQEKICALDSQQARALAAEVLTKELISETAAFFTKPGQNPARS